jgi:hypothetical protein
VLHQEVFHAVGYLAACRSIDDGLAEDDAGIALFNRNPPASSAIADDGVVAVPRMPLPRLPSGSLRRLVSHRCEFRTSGGNPPE